MSGFLHLLAGLTANGVRAMDWIHPVPHEAAIDTVDRRQMETLMAHRQEHIVNFEIIFRLTTKENSYADL